MQPSFEPTRRRSNTGLIVGLILGGIGLCCILPLGLLFGGGLFMLKQVGGFTTCQIAFNDLEKAFQDYAAANGGKLPRAASWQTDLQPFYAQRVTKHKDTGPIKLMPASGQWGCKTEKGSTGIAFNAALAEKKLAEIKNPKTTPLIFEIEEPKLNAAEPYKAREGSPETFMGKKRSYMVLMASGDLDVKGPKGEPFDMKIELE